MEIIRIKTAGPIQLTAYKDKIQFIVLEDLLNAMNVEYVEEVVEHIKQDMHWFTSIKEMELPEIGKKEVIQITHALGLIYWIPESVVMFIAKQEVYTILSMHLETYLEFYQWKIDAVEEHIQKVDNARNVLDENSEYIIEQQSQLIEKLKEALNIKTV